jgi:hypothetical protein
MTLPMVNRRSNCRDNPRGLDKNISSKSVKITANYVNGAMGTDAVVLIVCTADHPTISSVTFASCRYTIHLTDADPSKVAKLVPGHSATATGTVEDAVITDPTTDDENLQPGLPRAKSYGREPRLARGEPRG